MHDVAAETCFLAVPEALLLTSSSLPAALAAAAAGLRPEALLVLRLLFEVSTPSSAWSPYLRSLPTRYTDAGGWAAAETGRARSGGKEGGLGWSKRKGKGQG